MKWLFILLAFFLALSGFIGQSEATTRTVCPSGCDFNNIQYAIDASKDSDEVYVKGGTYKEHLIVKKSISLRGASRDTTVIDGSDSGACVSISADNTIITGFSLKNCKGLDARNSNNVEIYNNDIFGLNDWCNGDSFGVYLEDSTSRIYDNVIRNNNKGISLLRGSSEIRDNLIEKNCNGVVVGNTRQTQIFQNTIQLNQNGGVWVDASTNTSVFENDIINNSDEGIIVFLSSANIYNNYLKGNLNGIFLESSENNVITDNRFLYNQYGISQKLSGKSTIQSNSFRYNKYDIWFPESSYNTISKNNVCKTYFTESNNLTGNVCPYSKSPEIMSYSDIKSTDKERINISYTVIDDLDTSIDCSLSLDGLTKNVKALNNTPSTLEVVLSTSGIKSWNFICFDSDGNNATKSGIIEVNLPMAVKPKDSKNNNSASNIDNSEDDSAFNGFIVLLALFFTGRYIHSTIKRKKEAEALCIKQEEDRRIATQKAIEEEKRRKQEERKRKKQAKEERRLQEEARKKEALRRRRDERERKKQEEAKKKFEQEQAAKGLIKYMSGLYGERWGTPEEIKKWKEIEVGLDNNFADMSPFEFEHFISELFQKMGYKTQVTPKTGDYGVDVIAKKDNDCVAVQVKKYNHGTHVGAVDVQKLLGAMWKYKATHAIIVTSSSFTIQAKDQAREAPVELWDKYALHKMVKKYFIEGIGG